MLFVKNLMFLNGATATLAPDLDILAEITHVYLYFVAAARRADHGEIGIDPTPTGVDIDAVKAGVRRARRGRAASPSVTFRRAGRLILRRMQQRRRVDQSAHPSAAPSAGR